MPKFDPKRRDQVRETVACPQCGVAAGELCRGVRGAARVSLHQARWDASPPPPRFERTMIEARKTSVCTCGSVINPGDQIGRYATRYYQCAQCFTAALDEEGVLEELHETRDP